MNSIEKAIYQAAQAAGSISPGQVTKLLAAEFQEVADDLILMRYAGKLVTPAEQIAQLKNDPE
jgi:hypothetical protein